MLLKQAAHTVAWDQGKRPPLLLKKRQGLYYVALVGLEFTAVNLPVSASRGLGLNVCAIMPDRAERCTFPNTLLSLEVSQVKRLVLHYPPPVGRWSGVWDLAQPHSPSSALHHD